VDVERPSSAPSQRPPPVIITNDIPDDDHHVLVVQEPPTQPQDEVLPPLAEISFRRHHRDPCPRTDEGDDRDEEDVSETSTLLAPSTLTPNYNYNDNDNDNDKNNQNSQTRHRHHVSDCGEHTPHPSLSADEDGDDGDLPSKKAFRIAFLLGVLCVSLIFYADWITGGGDDRSFLPSNPSAAVVAADVRGNGNGDGGNRVERSATGAVEAGRNGIQVPVDNGSGSKAAKLAKREAKAAKLEKERERLRAAEEELREKENEDGTDEEQLEVAAKKWNEKNDAAWKEFSENDEEDAGENVGDDGEDDDDDDDDFHIPNPRHHIPSIHNRTPSHHNLTLPAPRARCPYVIQTFQQQNEGVTNLEFLREKYTAQSVDPNIFYRATALMFWKDFGAGYWGVDTDGDGRTKGIDLEDLVLLKEAKYYDGTPMSPMSTWTWITGDQHLSNFGAWRNRGGEVVFSVNDFDEAAIYDFHIDVLRVAVSICSHGFTNGLPVDRVEEALEAFTYAYVKTAIDYVGGDTALLFEMTPRTSTGVLRDFLWDTQENNSHSKQIEKFTEVGEDGVRRFTRSDKTRLVDVPPEIEEKVRAEIASKKYGASMMKMGWKVRGWDDDFFTVLDVARRVGSGIGSYGVDRFYVLLKGEDASLTAVDDGGDHASVILDIKFEPKSAVSRVLEEVDQDTKAWYDVIFNNEADRSAQAQRHLTSFTDPFVGYIEIDGNPYNVRQRSPWKTSLDYGKLTDPRAFIEVIEQIAIITATSHVRGSVSKSPAQFKHVVKLLLAGDHNRRRWNDLITDIALRYHEQVLLDFECFQEYVKELFPSG